MKYLIAAAVALALLVGGFLALKPTVTPEGDVQLGAVSGPDSSFPCETHNGVMQCFERTKMRTATTTVCSIKSPTASSTLVSAAAHFETASSSALLIEMGKATTPYATTTLLARLSNAAGAKASVIATTSATALTDGIVAPNSYINVMIAGAGGATSATAPVGNCQATFQVF